MSYSGLHIKNLLLVLSVFFFATAYAQNSSGKLEGEGMALKYLVKEPHVKSTNAPLIILLHGTGSNEVDLFGLTGQLPANSVIVSARAPITLSENSYTWYHIDFKTGAPSINNGEAENSRLLLLKFIKQLTDKYRTNPKQVYLLGFSQGSIMSYSIALTEPAMVKGIVALSGRILDEAKSKVASKDKFKNLSVFIAHGTNDKVLPIFHGREAHTFINKQKIKNAYHEYPMAHEISAQELKDIQAWFTGENVK